MQRNNLTLQLRSATCSTCSQPLQAIGRSPTNYAGGTAPSESRAVLRPEPGGPGRLRLPEHQQPSYGSPTMHRGAPGSTGASGTAGTAWITPEARLPAGFRAPTPLQGAALG